jgi:hypothetical protein
MSQGSKHKANKQTSIQTNNELSKNLSALKQKYPTLINNIVKLISEMTKKPCLRTLTAHDYNKERRMNPYSKWQVRH